MKFILIILILFKLVDCQEPLVHDFLLLGNDPSLIPHASLRIQSQLKSAEILHLRTLQSAAICEKTPFLSSEIHGQHDDACEASVASSLRWASSDRLWQVETSAGAVHFARKVLFFPADPEAPRLQGVEIVGRTYEPLRAVWAIQGAATLGGLQSKKFPNLYFLGGPQVPDDARIVDRQIEFLISMFEYMQMRGFVSSEPYADSQENWVCILFLFYFYLIYHYSNILINNDEKMNILSIH